jgi:hypothetical protein
MLLNPRALNGRQYELRDSCQRHPEASDIRQLEQRRRKIVCGELTPFTFTELVPV